MIGWVYTPVVTYSFLSLLWLSFSAKVFFFFFFLTVIKIFYTSITTCVAGRPITILVLWFGKVLAFTTIRTRTSASKVSFLYGSRIWRLIVVTVKVIVASIISKTTCILTKSTIAVRFVTNMAASKAITTLKFPPWPKLPFPLKQPLAKIFRTILNWMRHYPSLAYPGLSLLHSYGYSQDGISEWQSYPWSYGHLKL